MRPDSTNSTSPMPGSGLAPSTGPGQISADVIASSTVRSCGCLMSSGRPLKAEPSSARTGSTGLIPDRSKRGGGARSLNYRTPGGLPSAARSSVSVGPPPQATRSCRSRTTTTSKSTTATSATSTMSTPTLDRQFSTAAPYLRLQRTRHADPGLCLDDPQEPRLRTFSCPEALRNGPDRAACHNG